MQMIGNLFQARGKSVGKGRRSWVGGAGCGGGRLVFGERMINSECMEGN